MSVNQHCILMAAAQNLATLLGVTKKRRKKPILKTEFDTINVEKEQQKMNNDRKLGTGCLEERVLPMYPLICGVPQGSPLPSVVQHLHAAPCPTGAEFRAGMSPVHFTCRRAVSLVLPQQIWPRDWRLWWEAKPAEMESFQDRGSMVRVWRFRFQVSTPGSMCP